MELQEIIILVAIIVGIFLLKVYQPGVYDTVDGMATSAFKVGFDKAENLISNQMGSPDKQNECMTDADCMNLYNNTSIKCNAYGICEG